MHVHTVEYLPGIRAVLVFTPSTARAGHNGADMVPALGRCGQEDLECRAILSGLHRKLKTGLCEAPAAEAHNTSK